MLFRGQAETSLDDELLQKRKQVQGSGSPDQAQTRREAAEEGARNVMLLGRATAKAEEERQTREAKAEVEEARSTAQFQAEKGKQICI